MNGKDFWQIGVVVPDVEEGMAELSAALELTWGEPQDRTGLDGAPLRAVLSREGPPYFELIEGGQGSKWESSGFRVDHLAYWVDDVPGERRRLEDAGVLVIADGEVSGRPVNFHEAPRSGFRIEVMSTEYKPLMREGWQLSDVG